MSKKRQAVRRSETSACVALLILLTACPPVFAQCPDGTPPPCAASRRAAPARRVPPPAAERRRSFLVLPFRNLSRSTELEWLVEGSPVLITDALSRNDDVTVVPDERLYPALQRAGLTPGAVMDLARVRRVAEQTSAWTAVTGEILAFGDRIRVSARAFDVVTNAEVMRAVEESAPGEDVRAVYQRLGTQLIRVAGFRDAAAADIATTTTRSVDAYRAYVRGVGHANRSEARRARDAFLEAVRLDSGYAQAYARLADAEMGVDPRQVMNPQSGFYRYAARAAALADNLPARDRELVLAINDILSARFTRARERLLALLAEDSLNVDALEWRASLEFMDPVLVPAGGGERPRGSINVGLAAAKRALEIDPSRHQLYGSLVQSYLIAAGGTPGFTMGYRREPSSLPAMIASTPDRTFIPLLRDTIVLAPVESLATLFPGDSLRLARRGALDAALSWARRWLAAGPAEAESHLWASRAHALAGDYLSALRELEQADSLGVESGHENVPARRMSLLARLERYADGTRIADSLWNARALEVSVLTAYQIEGLGWAWMLFVLERRYDQATALHNALATSLAPATIANPQLTPDALAFLLLSGNVDVYFSSPAVVRLRVAERLLEDAAPLHDGPLARVLPFQITILLNDTAVPDRPALARRALATADRLVPAHPDLAYRLAAAAAQEDTTVRAAAMERPWFAARREAATQLRLATLRRMRPLGATVTDSSAVFRWAIGGDSLHWNRVETTPGDQDYRWEAEFEAAGARYEALAGLGGAPAAQPRTATVAEGVRAAVRMLHQIVGTDSNAVHRTVPNIAVRAEAEAGGIRLVLRDPRLVAALRTERPATVRMRFRPCAKPAGAAQAECAEADVPVTYP